MKMTIAALLLVLPVALSAEEPRRHFDDPLAQAEGMAQKPYTMGGPLPKYCTEKEWTQAIEATIAATRDIPLGATAEFIRRANEIAAKFGC